MLKTNHRIILILILVLVFIAGNLTYPNYLNKGIELVNNKLHLKVPYFWNIPFKLGLDLQGGIHLIYEADLSSIKKENYDSSMQGLRDVIERRINYFGVREPAVQVQESSGQYRLIVELAGITDPAEAIKMIGETPYLEFKEQKADYDEIMQRNVEANKIGGQLEDPFQSTILTGKYLKNAEVIFDQTTYKPLVSLQFNDEGAVIFEELTARNVGKMLPIYIDGILISAPNVQEKIAGGKAQISGTFTAQEAKDLVLNLNSGALPVPIKLISQQSVGPTLGAISLQKSLKAGLLGFLAVILFMIIFYRLPGVMASISLIIYAILTLSLFKIIPVTLTLAGIGGFILSIGMAVDANVLIFSRMREELKQGKDLGQAIEEGFTRAWPSIRDGNFTTLIVTAILFGFGTSFIKGFALTLSLGILISMFSAIFITRNLLRLIRNIKLAKVKWLW